MDRATELLIAARDILQKAHDSCCVLDVMSETVFYDQTDCDGYCLLDDIKSHLETTKEW